MFELYDKVLLKSGETAYIVEVYGNGEAYEMDIDKDEGRIVTDTVWPEQIEKKVLDAE